MSANEFEGKKTEVTTAIAEVLGVHPSMCVVAIKTHRRLASGDSVVLEVAVFVTPGTAAAMETKVTAVKASPSFLASQVSTAAGPTVTATATVTAPTQQADQSPPAATTTTAPSTPPVAVESQDANSAGSTGVSLGFGLTALAAWHVAC
jgi:hypothetical protein